MFNFTKTKGELHSKGVPVVTSQQIIAQFTAFNDNANSINREFPTIYRAFFAFQYFIEAH